MHSGNLRENNNKQNRYSKIFSNTKISYWADSKKTAVAEMKKHNRSKNYITFFAYDDSSSAFPILGNTEKLLIIDGRECKLESILLKFQKGNELNKREKSLIRRIMKENPDCLAYNSLACNGGTNFLFFEKGFKKLALKDVSAYWGENKSRNSNNISCATGCDYLPDIKSYGCYFKSIAQVQYDKKYLETLEYKERSKRLKDVYDKIRKESCL